MPKKKASPRRIYIMTDLEGIANVDTMDHMDKETQPYRDACHELMRDTNAAIAGAFDGGATEVVVRDGHTGGGNFIDGMLDERVTQDRRRIAEFFRSTRKKFEAVFFVGCHAMAGTLNGFLDHTQNSRQWFEYRLNGRPTGEIGMIAAAAGAFDLPLTLVTGDEAACQEARAFVGNLETAAVKQGVGRNRARLYDADDARRRIREAACRAVRLSEAVRPFKPLAPIDVQLTLYRSDMCDALAERLGHEVERLDARTVRKIARDGSQVYF